VYTLNQHPVIKYRQQ